MRTIFLSGLLALADGQASAVTVCNDKKVAALMLEDDAAGAMKLVTDCVTVYRADRGTKGGMLEEIAKSRASFWLLDRAALHAVLGEAKEAREDLAAARADIGEQFPAGDTASYGITMKLSDYTEAFLREKAGDKAGARAKYGGLAGPIGGPSPVDKIVLADAAARMALLDLDSGKTELARAGALAEPLHPVSRLVLGELALAAGMKDSARLHFDAGLKSLADSAKGNPSLLILYTEHARLAAGRESTLTPEPPKTEPQK